MTRELFLKDAYLKSFESRILLLDGREVVLEETAFYPGGGGQPADKGRLKTGPVGAAVVDVRREGDDIVHVLDRPIPGTVERIGGELDWERRYTHMRYRTALYLLSGVLRESFGAEEVTAGRIRAAGARLDFSPGERPVVVGEIQARVNETLSTGLPVRVYEAEYEEALSAGRPGGVLPSGKARVVEVEGLGARADGGIHVADTREVGKIAVTGHEGRDRGSVRLWFALG